MQERKRRWQKQNTGFPYSHLHSPTPLHIVPDTEMSYDEIFSDESSFYGKFSS
jgi:hypothetical protein